MNKTKDSCIGQVPVIATDQSIDTVAYPIVWHWPEDYGEGNFVIMYIGRHIEMVELTLKQWVDKIPLLSQI